MTKVRITRRQRSAPPRALTAAVQRVVDPSKVFRNTILAGQGEGWQAEAWRYLEFVGELAYYAGWRSSSASRCRLVASGLDDDGKPNLEAPDNIQKLVADIAGGATGQAQLILRSVFLLTVPGECWVTMCVRDPAAELNPDGTPVAPDVAALLEEDPGETAENWYVFGRDEIRVRGNTVEFCLPDGALHVFNPKTDIMFRVWNPHPKNAHWATSPVWSNRAALNEIVRATATIDNANKSRLIGNGIMFIPQEMNLPQPVEPVAAPPTGDPDPSEPEMAWQPASSVQLQQLIYDVATTAIKEPNSMAAMLPIIASTPGEWIKNIQWLRPSSDVPEQALATRESGVKRLAMGLDMSPERLLGMGENANHWSSWLADESDAKIHIAPVVEVLCDALTREVLRPLLIEQGIDPTDYVIWHDDTDLTQNPDKKIEAQEAYDRGAMTSASLRQYLGFDDEDGYDLSTKDGATEWAMDKVAEDPSLVPLMKPLLPEWFQDMQGAPVAVTALPQPGVPPPPTPTIIGRAEGDGSGGTTEGPPSQQNSAAVAASAYVQLCVNRALELANKRRRTRDTTDQFRDVPVHLAHVNLPTVAGTVENLLRGWDEIVDTSSLIAMRVDPVGFANMVETIAERALRNSAPPTFSVAELRRVMV